MNIENVDLLGFNYINCKNDINNNNIIQNIQSSITETYMFYMLHKHLNVLTFYKLIVTQIHYICNFGRVESVKIETLLLKINKIPKIRYVTKQSLIGDLKSFTDKNNRENIKFESNKKQIFKVDIMCSDNKNEQVYINFELFKENSFLKYNSSSEYFDKYEPNNFFKVIKESSEIDEESCDNNIENINFMLLGINLPDDLNENNSGIIKIYASSINKNNDVILYRIRIDKSEMQTKRITFDIIDRVGVIKIVPKNQIIFKVNEENDVYSFDILYMSIKCHKCNDINLYDSFIQKCRSCNLNTLIGFSGEKILVFKNEINSLQFTYNEKIFTQTVHKTIFDDIIIIGYRLNISNDKISGKDFTNYNIFFRRDDKIFEMEITWNSNTYLVDFKTVKQVGTLHFLSEETKRCKLVKYDYYGYIIYTFLFGVTNIITCKVNNCSIKINNNFFTGTSKRNNINYENKSEVIRDIYLFNGDSLMGKTFIASKTSLNVYETDLEKKIPDDIYHYDVIIIGNKYNNHYENVRCKLNKKTSLFRIIDVDFSIK